MYLNCSVNHQRAGHLRVGSHFPVFFVVKKPEGLGRLGLSRYLVQLPSSLGFGVCLAGGIPAVSGLSAEHRILMLRSPEGSRS